MKFSVCHRRPGNAVLPVLTPVMLQLTPVTSLLKDKCEVLTPASPRRRDILVLTVCFSITADEGLW